MWRPHDIWYARSLVGTAFVECGTAKLGHGAEVQVFASHVSSLLAKACIWCRVDCD